jgi:transposase
MKISDTTIRSILARHGIANWRAKKRPELTEAVAAKRLSWCLARKDWNYEQWKKYMWSDECSAERGKGKMGEWVFCTPAQKWDPEMVQTYKKSKDLSVMVWGCFWGGGRSELYILDRDFESKKHGYTANSYIEVLEDQIQRCWMPGLIFMQDNAPIHTAGKVEQWFKDAAIPVSDWPPYSPDLNPIEQAWFHLKKMVLKMHPELEACTGKSEQDIQNLEKALVEAWNALPESMFESLGKSMEMRVAAVIGANGWHTKY